MKQKASRRRLLSLPAIILAGALAPHAAMAETYTWGSTTAGTYNWDNNLSADPLSTENNWNTDPAGGFPSVIDDVATITKIPTGAVSINLNQAITVGTLTIGANQVASSPTGLRYNLNANGGSLTMDVTEGNATIAISAGATLGKDPDTINGNIQINDHLVLYNGSTDVRGTLTINGIISGSGMSLTKAGNNLARLIGAQTYDGGTSIDEGTLQLGSGVVGGNATVMGDIVINENGTLSVNNADAQTLSGANFSGTGSFKKTGAAL